MKRLLAVLGGDVSSSLSPVLHMAAARACDLDIAYVPVSCDDSAHFARALDALETLGARGCNVTIPFKDDARQLATRSTAVAEQIGAVNTLTFEAGARVGDNTDGPALLQILGALPSDRRARVQVLGAGGAARAAVWALGQLGVDAVTVCARDAASAESVAALASGTPGPLSRVRNATLVVSALPGPVAERAWSVIDRSGAPYVVDLAYGGVTRPSALVEKARAAGLNARDGRDMLIEQAARALAGWTGGEVSLIRAAMRDVLPDA